MRSQHKITLFYLIVGSLWILVSDSFISTLFGGQPEILKQLQLYKGWLFIGVTGFLLYVMLNQAFRARDRAERQIREREQQHRKLQEDAREKERLQMMLNKELELRDLRDRFMAMLSHEFRSPLAAFFTATDMLDHYGDRMTPEARHNRYNQMRQQVNRLLELLDDFLTIMRTEKLGLEFKPAPIDLVSFCNTLADELGIQAKDTHRLLLTSNQEVIPIHSNEKLLRHILGNLLTNAIKYSPEGGTITIDVQQENDTISIRVKDQGIGIPLEDQKVLFDAFHRARNVGQIPGSGLGLAIVRQAVELHNGTIQVESQPGQGSTFMVRIPASNNGHGKQAS